MIPQARTSGPRKAGESDMPEVPFQEAIRSWQMFYATLAAASATLTGLLFVSLSLNRDRLKGKRAGATAQIARTTFGDFLYVIMISLVFLVPHLIPFSLVISLLVLGLARGVGIAREILHRQSSKVKFVGWKDVLQQIGLPGVISFGIILVSISIAVGQYNILYGLVGVIAALLVSACWNAWILLFLD
jgi:hypothetical protein